MGVEQGTSTSDAGEADDSGLDSLLREVARLPHTIALPLQPGAQVMDRFVIERRAGAGGMGVIYRATDRATGETIALKTMASADHDGTDRFSREARMLAELAHPGIVRYVAHGVLGGGEAYLAMEWLDGEDLAARLRRAPLDVRQSLAVAQHAAEALGHAHARGAVHRDVKPSNIFLVDGDPARTKILDFGLVRPAVASRALTASGAVLGTVGYMAPEQARGERDVDARADVFSLGCVLFECLTGRPAFAGEHVVAVLSKVLTEEAPRLAQLRPDLPAPLDALLSRMLAKAPDARPADGAEVARALAEISLDARSPAPMPRAGTPLPTAAGTPAAQARSWRRSAALGAAALAALAFVGLRKLPRPAPQPRDASPSATASTPFDAGRRGVAATDHPPPRSSSREAASAYAAAVQSYRDASIALGDRKIEEALKIDPGLAAAHLRRVLLGPGNREGFAAASGLRAALDDRDRALLPVADAMTTEPLDAEELVRRARAAAEQLPDDAEVAYVLGWALYLRGSIEEASAAYHRALELDPQFALAVWGEARLYHENDQQRPLLGRCLEISPMAATCMRRLATIHEVRGECAAFAADAKRMLRAEPRGFRAYEYTARALAAAGAPLSSVKTSLDTMVASSVERLYSGAPAQLAEDLWLAVLAGDLARAETAAWAIDRALATSTDEGAHGAVADLLVDLAEEHGEPAKALEVVEDFAKRAPAWDGLAPYRFRVRRLYLLHQGGRLADGPFREERARLYEHYLSQLPPGREKTELDEVWREFHVRHAASRSEVAEALEGLEARGVPSDLGLLGWRIGRVLLAGGRTDQAIPLLKAAASSCSILPGVESGEYGRTIHFLRAHLLLGRALEAKRDQPGACEAYRAILERWKAARPRSVTLDEARARVRALGCGGPG